MIDGDILCYRIGFASEGVPERWVKARVDGFLHELLLYGSDTTEYEGFLSGKENFRDAIAVTAPYKGNRPERKPQHYQFIRDYLASAWDFTTSVGEEADDAIAIRATALGDCAVICSIDKDFDQVPGWHYNFVKRRLYYVTPSEGLRNFYLQILTGDRVDNIIGLRGIGPARASKLLQDCDGEQDFLEATLEAYGGDAGRVEENGRLLWLRRQEGQLWSLPSVSSAEPISPTKTESD